MRHELTKLIYQRIRPIWRGYNYLRFVEQELRELRAMVLLNRLFDLGNSMRLKNCASKTLAPISAMRGNERGQ